jgi:hypothetical protein
VALAIAVIAIEQQLESSKGSDRGCSSHPE